MLAISAQVTYLTAAGNELTGEGLDGVRPLKDLKVFNASGNRVRRIPPTVFAQFRQLQVTRCSIYDDISLLPPEVLGVTVSTVADHVDVPTDDAYGFCPLASDTLL